MSNSTSIKHVFPGSNTAKGFYSFFDNILPASEANKIYVIKGGPGTGKSSLMKQIGNYAVSKNYKVEYFHCSSDPNSLDALVIPELKVSFLDGTAPHIVDPKYPGAVDIILNLGQNWDETQLRVHRESIIDCSERISRLFKKAYFYLDAAYSIYQGCVFVESHCILDSAKNMIEEKIFNEFIGNEKFSEIPGKARHLFSTAITGEGILDYLHTIIGDTKNVYFIKETLGCNSKQLMKRISEQAVRCGLDIECYHSPIDVDKIEDILIPSLGCVITVSNQLHKPKVFPTHIYDLTSAIDQSKLNRVEFELDRDRKLFLDLIDKGVKCISQAKKLHDELENYYISAVDFTRMDPLFDEIVESLFNQK